jgi:hypothetical protein
MGYEKTAGSGYTGGTDGVGSSDSVAAARAISKGLGSGSYPRGLLIGLGMLMRPEGGPLRSTAGTGGVAGT